MPWSDQQPEATDILLSGIHLDVKGQPDSTVFGEIDKLPDGTYRATAGNLFQSIEIGRNVHLETLLRQVAMAKLSSKPK